VLIELGEPPAGPFDDSVAVLSCRDDYQPGLYEVRDLATPPFGPRMQELPEPRKPATLPDDASSLIAESEYVVLDPRCFDGAVPGLQAGHTLLTRRASSKLMSAYEIWVRGPLARSGSSGSGKGRTPSGGSEPEDDQDEAGGP
jgi:hypothetical protein